MTIRAEVDLLDVGVRVGQPVRPRTAVHRDLHVVRRDPRIVLGGPRDDEPDRDGVVDGRIEIPVRGRRVVEIRRHTSGAVRNSCF